jgi:predicted nucleic acid-binding protein
MSPLYAESGAILRWLLGAPDASTMKALLAAAPDVVTSVLTTAEVARTLRRLVAIGALSPEARERAWLRYASAVAHWHCHAVNDVVLERVHLPFPSEPVRTLDAIHLATAAHFSARVEPVRVLSVDKTVRANATALGLEVEPA